MAEEQRPTSRRRARRQASDGPFLSVASFCEAALREDDGRYSLIRLFDVITVDRPRPAADGDERIQIQTTLFLLFRAGSGPSSRMLTIVQRLPDGRRKRPGQGQPLTFVGNGQGVPVQVNARFIIEQEGLHWFDILLDDIVQTRVPLAVQFREQPEGAGPEETPSEEEEATP